MMPTTSETWLFTPEKPAVLEAAGATAYSTADTTATDLAQATSAIDKLADRVGANR
jgi:hypothetical protein